MIFFTQRVLYWLGLLETLEEAPNRRGAQGRAIARDQLPERAQWKTIAALVASTLVGFGLMGFAIALYDIVGCAEEVTQPGTLFGNDCQDRLFYGQWLLMVFGAYVVWRSLLGIWRQFH